MRGFLTSAVAKKARKTGIQIYTDMHKTTPCSSAAVPEFFQAWRFFIRRMVLWRARCEERKTHGIENDMTEFRLCHQLRDQAGWHRRWLKCCKREELQQFSWCRIH